MTEINWARFGRQFAGWLLAVVVVLVVALGIGVALTLYPLATLGVGILGLITLLALEGNHD